MIVVSDASPINVLIRIGLIDILPSLYRQIVIPSMVAAELAHPRAPDAIRRWITEPPAWLLVRSPTVVPQTLSIVGGERDAIALAIELRAELLVVDDHKARKAAERHGVPIVGTLGVLEAAADARLVDLDASIARLLQTDFAVSRALIQSIRSRRSIGGS